MTWKYGNRRHYTIIRGKRNILLSGNSSSHFGRFTILHCKLTSYMSIDLREQTKHGKINHYSINAIVFEFKKLQLTQHFDIKDSELESRPKSSRPRLERAEAFSKKSRRDPDLVCQDRNETRDF